MLIALKRGEKQIAINILSRCILNGYCLRLYADLSEQDYPKYQANLAIKGFDVLHQLFRLRYTKNITEAETLAIMRTLADNVRSYDQVVEAGFCSDMHC